MLLSVFISYSKKEIAIIFICETKFGAFLQKYFIVIINWYVVCTCYLQYVFMWLHIIFTVLVTITRQALERHDVIALTRTYYTYIVYNTNTCIKENMNINFDKILYTPCL